MVEDAPRPSYRKEFLRSPHHAVLGLATLGVGFMMGSALPLLLGAGAYALGWIYLPDLPFFRRWVDRKYEAAAAARAAAELAAFQERRSRIISALTTRNREKYAEMIAVCQGIEKANMDAAAAVDGEADPRLRKLDELGWTYLRLLSFQQSLEEFLETERREDLPAAQKEAAGEALGLEKEIAAFRARKEQPPESRQRLLDSARERVAVLQKRIDRIEQARENLRLAASEQERLVQQVKLIRADTVATKNARNFSTRIDATVEHLDETNKWLTEIEDFKDLVGDIPRTDARIGLGDPAVAAADATLARRQKTLGQEI